MRISRRLRLCVTIGKWPCSMACAALLMISGCRRTDDSAHNHFVDADAGGHHLHMLIVGEAGPTVVLESGLGGGLGWEQVRSGVSSFARAVTYDRAGFGKSEPGPFPRTARQIASELHAALHNAALPAPYLLVGHSMGGPYVRVFAAQYPDEVSGIVLVDPTQINTYESMEEIKSWFDAHCSQDWDVVRAHCEQSPEAAHGLGWMPGLEAKRIEQFLATVPEPRREAIRREWKSELAKSVAHSSTELSPSVREEFQAATESFQEAIAAEPLPKGPIILLAASGSGSIYEIGSGLDPNLRMLQDETRRWHIEDYRAWIKLTPGTKLVVANGCGHNIQMDDPSLVIQAVREILEQRMKTGR